MPRRVGSLEIVTSFLDNLAYGKCQSTHLIVVPSYLSILAVYLKQFCPGLKTVTFSPNKTALFQLNDQVLEDDFNICLTSYQMQEYNAHLRRIRWESIVFDGTDKIKELKDIILSSFSSLVGGGYL